MTHKDSKGRRAGTGRLARTRARVASLCSVAMVAGLVAACGADSSEPAGHAGREQRNVLLVIVDTLRADKLGCYGNERGLTPRLDGLAAQGLVFEHASAHAPWTLPSTASLLTSLLPRQHGAGGRVPEFTALGDEVETLAERFGDAGYRTATIANVIFLGPLFGLTRGFEHVDVQSFEDNVRMRPAEATTAAALAWLDQADDRPFFMLVHYFDPHAVYDPPQPFRRRFADPKDREGGLRFGTREQMVGLRTGAFDPGPGLVRRAEALYDGEIAYTDEQVGRLLDGLVERGLDDSTLIVFTSDHGEEFREHGGLEHGHSLYSELLHVPLIVRAPGVRAGRVASSVGHVDVAPTVCSWAGLELSPQYAGAVLAADTPDRDVLAHGNFWNAPLTSWRTADSKLIVLPRDAVELYAWRADPGETQDLSADEARVDALRRALAAAEQRFAARGTGTRVDVSDEGLRGLEALGYTDGPVDRDDE